MPRAGSTVLCGILNQRPDSHATSTSNLVGYMRALCGVSSSRIEFKNLLNIDQPATQARFTKSMRAFVDAWHGVHGKEVVFDKCRAWNFFPRHLRDIAPEGKLLLCVRDLRDIFASVEREDRKYSLVGDAPITLRNRYAYHFAPEGVIGGPLRAVIDLIDNNPQNKPDNIVVVHYERLVAEPAKMMAEIDKALGLEPFEYDFGNIPDTAIDPDGFYLGKFPHRVGKTLDPKRCEPWQDVIPTVIAADIMKSYPLYHNFFEYLRPMDTGPEIHAEGSGPPEPMLEIVAPEPQPVPTEPTHNQEVQT